MRNYLILREKARAFRADPEVAEALDAARVAELAVPTLGEGESLDALRAEAHDPVALGERGLHFERLDQLAMEHLLGGRRPASCGAVPRGSARGAAPEGSPAG